MSSIASSFAYGLLAGQFSALVLMALFIRFFIFADKPAAAVRGAARPSPVSVQPSAPAGVSTILEKTYYNVADHEAESLDWFTVLIAQVVRQLREDARTNDNILHTVETVLNNGGSSKLPDYVDSIKVTELNIGDDYPIFSNCRIYQAREKAEDKQRRSLFSNKEPPDTEQDEDTFLEAQMDVDLADTLTLGIETRLLLNFPKPRFAFLPVSLAVSIVRFSGTLTVSLRKLRQDSESKTYLTFSFAPDYRLEFSVKSLLGARSRLQDVPKIGQLVEARLRKWFKDRCVSPRYQQIALPDFWPRSKTTKEHAAGASTVPVPVPVSSPVLGFSGASASASPLNLSAGSPQTLGRRSFSVEDPSLRRRVLQKGVNEP